MPIFESVTVEFVKYSKKITKLSQLSYFCQNLVSRQYLQSRFKPMNNRIDPINTLILSDSSVPTGFLAARNGAERRADKRNDPASIRKTKTGRSPPR